MLKREWGAESHGKLPHLFISGENAAMVPEFAVEDLPLGRTAALVPEFAVKDLSLGRTPDDIKFADFVVFTYLFVRDLLQLLTRNCREINISYFFRSINYVGQLAQAGAWLRAERPGLVFGWRWGADFCSFLVSRLILGSTQPSVK